MDPQSLLQSFFVCLFVCFVCFLINNLSLFVGCRQRALKALDERLKKSTEPTNWPSMEDAGSSSGPEEPSAPQLKTSPSVTGQLEAVVVEKTPSNTVSPATSGTKASSPSD